MNNHGNTSKTDSHKMLILILICIGLMPFSLNAQEIDKKTLQNIKLGNVEYSIEILSITKNKEGNVEVKVNGSEKGKEHKFWQISSNGNTFNVPPTVGVEIISGGNTISTNRWSIQEDGLLVEFPTKTLPSRVIFFSVKEENQKVVFDAKSKKPIDK